MSWTNFSASQGRNRLVPASRSSGRRPALAAEIAWRCFWPEPRDFLDGHARRLEQLATASRDATPRTETLRWRLDDSAAAR